MERILEPELMDSAPQVLAYASADFGDSDASVLSRLQELFKELEEEPRAEDLLVDLGCGPGNITERLHRCWPFARVVGLDGSERMLAAARARLADRSNSEGHLQYRRVGLAELVKDGWSAVTDFTPSPAMLVVSNSVLHHLHHPLMLWQATRQLCRPGAVVLHRDLRRPASAQEALALRERYLPKAPEVLRCDYLASLHAAFTIEEVQTQLDQSGLGTLRVDAVADRYLEVSGRMP